MFRHRTRRPIPPLDDVTAERLLAGAPVDDLPDEYRALAGLLSAARGDATAAELAGEAAAMDAFASAYGAANRPAGRTRTLAVASVVTLLVALSAGTAVAADAGVLPDPAQAAAHDVLGVVGISVPGIGDHEHAPPNAKFDEPTATLPTDVTGVRPTGATTPSGADPDAGPLATTAGSDGSDHSSSASNSSGANKPDGSGTDNGGSNAGGPPRDPGKAPDSPPGQDDKDQGSQKPDTPPGQDKR